MINDNDAFNNDIWSNWLTHDRHGGDRQAEHFMRADTERFADRVINGANIEAGMTLLDVGTGDGLVAFRAIDRVGPALNVILTDISVPMLAHVQKLAARNGIADQCSFIRCSADELSSIVGNSVDAVVTRAVLSYVDNKSASFSEFYRVLKPGGRVSICEPIMRDEAFGVYMLKKLVAADSLESKDRLLGLQCRIMAIQYPSTLEEIGNNPTTNFTERDLIHLARGAGFTQVHMELHIDSRRNFQRNWETFLNSSPHPLAPSVQKIINDNFSGEESKYFEEKFRPIVEAGSSIMTIRNAYLTATKPLTVF